MIKEVFLLISNTYALQLVLDVCRYQVTALGENVLNFFLLFNYMIRFSFAKEFEVAVHSLNA